MARVRRSDGDSAGGWLRQRQSYDRCNNAAAAGERICHVPRANLDSPPPATARLLRLIDSTLAKATSVHIDAARLPWTSHFGVNLSLTRSGDAAGDISFYNQPLTVLVTHQHAYLKVTSVTTLQVMGLPSAACAVACGKYLTMSAQRLLGGISWQSLVGPATSVPQLQYVRPQTVNGQPTWEMRGPGRSRIYLAARGAPYLLRVVSKHLGRDDFTQWNTAAIPPPPPASQVISLSQLKHP